jgi:hypothetical protein
MSFLKSSVKSMKLLETSNPDLRTFNLYFSAVSIDDLPFAPSQLCF